MNVNQNTERPDGSHTSRHESHRGCPARWYEEEEKGDVLCRLCARYCHIAEGKRGYCFVRLNVGGRLYNTACGHAIGLAVDKIEKKPLYHFYPGSSALSFGTPGCNMGCLYCQNWQMSRCRSERREERRWTAEEIVAMAIDSGCRSIAYTYNEPTIFGEWVVEVASHARSQGVKNVMVTNGYVSMEARRELYRDIDAANVDLKGFTERFYRKLTFSHLAPVLETLRWLVRETSVWTEVTTLLIPGENDSPEELMALCGFIAKELGSSVPLHLSAFHGDYKMPDHPPTTLESLLRAREIALQSGLKHVYLGNIATGDGADTFCSSCGEPLIIRNPFSTPSSRLTAGGCPVCRTPLEGRFNVEKRRDP